MTLSELMNLYHSEYNAVDWQPKYATMIPNCSSSGI